MAVTVPGATSSARAIVPGEDDATVVAVLLEVDTLEIIFDSTGRHSGLRNVLVYTNIEPDRPRLTNP